MNATPLSLDLAREILAAYSCLTPKAPADTSERQELQQALQVMTNHSDWENYGICADNYDEARATLDSYLQALGYPTAPASEPPANADAPIYMKYNTQRQILYCDGYEGDRRGVLVACQSEDDAVAGTYGHLPLDLYSD